MIGFCLDWPQPQHPGRAWVLGTSHDLPNPILLLVQNGVGWGTLAPLAQELMGQRQEGERGKADCQTPLQRVLPTEGTQGPHSVPGGPSPDKPGNPNASPPCKGLPTAPHLQSPASRPCEHSVSVGKGGAKWRGR